MKRLIVGVALLLSFSIPAAIIMPASAQFEPIKTSCEEGKNTQNSEICKDQNQTENPVSGSSGVIIDIVNILALVGGVLAVVIIVVSGISMITSQGDASTVKKNRDAVLYTAVGLVVIVIARTIIVYIIQNFT